MLCHVTIKYIKEHIHSPYVYYIWSHFFLGKCKVLLPVIIMKNIISSLLLLITLVSGFLSWLSSSFSVLLFTTTSLFSVLLGEPLEYLMCYKYWKKGNSSTNDSHFFFFKNSNGFNNYLTWDIYSFIVFVTFFFCF